MVYHGKREVKAIDNSLMTLPFPTLAMCAAGVGQNDGSIGIEIPQAF